MELDWFGCSLRHLVNTFGELTARGVGLTVFTGEGAVIDTTTASARLMLGIEERTRFGCEGTVSLLGLFGELLTRLVSMSRRIVVDRLVGAVLLFRFFSEKISEIFAVSRLQVLKGGISVRRIPELFSEKFKPGAAVID